MKAARSLRCARCQSRQPMNSASRSRADAAPNSTWSGWSSLGGVLTTDTAVIGNKDGRMEIFVRGSDNGLWHRWQTAPSNGWN